MNDQMVPPRVDRMDSDVGVGLRPCRKETQIGRTHANIDQSMARRLVARSSATTGS